MEMRKITISIDDELARKLKETAINGYHLSIENYIVHVLEEDMDDAERYFRGEGVDIFKS
jgi:hypothetical protein